MESLPLLSRLGSQRSSGPWDLEQRRDLGPRAVQMLAVLSLIRIPRTKEQSPSLCSPKLALSQLQILRTREGKSEPGLTLERLVLGIELWVPMHT